MPEARQTYRLLLHPIVWGVLALVALSIALSGKLSTDGAIWIMFLAGVLASYGGYVYVTSLKLTLAKTLGVVVAQACIFLFVTFLVINWMTQKALSPEPSLEVLFDGATHNFNLINRGQSNVYIWGSRYGGEDNDDSIDPKYLDVPRTIAANGGTYHLYANVLADQIRLKAAEGGGTLDARIPYWVYITMDDKRQRILKYQLWIHSVKNDVIVETQNLGTELKDFYHR